MYTSPDEARSDLFLAGAVYLLGPIVLQVLLGIVPLLRVPVLGAVLLVLLPLVTTVLVPYLLIRYRREPWSMYGIGTGTSTLLGGVLLAVPIAVASLLGTGARVLVADGFPLLALLGGPLGLAIRLARWTGLAALAVYGTVKARDAFRGEPMYVRTAVREIGRILAIVVAVASVLLLVGGLVRDALSGAYLLELVLVPLGAAAGVWLVERRLGGPSVSLRATLLTPVVLLALGPFAFRFDALQLLEGIRSAAVVGAVGLGLGALVEARRNALAVVPVAVLLGLFTPL